MRKQLFGLVLPILVAMCAILGWVVEVTAVTATPATSVNTRDYHVLVRSGLRASGVTVPVTESAFTLHLPVVVRPMVINTTADGADWSPGDGRCETAPSNNQCTLRAIIQETNAQPGIDTIAIPPGTYLLTIPEGAEGAGAAGDLDITDDLTIIAENPATTIIDGNQLDRILHIASDTTVYLSGVTIMNGSVTSANSISSSGGGIKNEGNLTIENSIIRHNVADADLGTGRGGGLFSSGPLLLRSTTIIYNESEGGGGLYVDGDVNVSIEDCTIDFNTAIHGNGGGMGIGAYPNVAIIRTSISNNSSNRSDNWPSGVLDGGGLYSRSIDSVTIIDSTIQSNKVDGYGGGIGNDPHFYQEGDLNLIRTTVSENAARYRGGGIFSNGSLTMTNVTLSNNRSFFPNEPSDDNYGGGLFFFGAIGTIVNSTIIQNQAYDEGGGIARGSGEVTIRNSIIAENMAILTPETNNCWYFAVTSLGYNLEDESTCQLDAEGDLRNADPNLGPLQMNGGPTPTHAVPFGSPAMDAGTNDGCPSIDQRGAIRPVDGDGDGHAICDVGAYEYP